MGLFYCPKFGKGLLMGHIIAEQKSKSAAWSAMMNGGVIVILPKGDCKNLPKGDG